MVTNISVVGLDDVHRAQLETLPGAERYALNPLFTHSEIKQQESFPVARLLEQGTHILRSFPESVDAVIGYWDFPVSTTLPILRRRLGLPGPSLESVLKCEHKSCRPGAAAEHALAFSAVNPELKVAGKGA
jgi:hypothetical protein